MIENRGNFWKKRLFRQAVCLGTIHACLLGTTHSFGLAQELPGLPPTSLMPTRPTTPSAKSSAGVGITILPESPPATFVGAPGNRFLADSLPVRAAPQLNSGVVTVTLQDQTETYPGNSNAGLPRVFLPATGNLPSPQAIGPTIVENDKAKSTGPVKLSFGDSGIVDLGIARPRQEPSLSPRIPELLRPERHSISQTVVLAQAAQLTGDGSDASDTIAGLSEARTFETAADSVVRTNQEMPLSPLVPLERITPPTPMPLSRTDETTIAAQSAPETRVAEPSVPIAKELTDGATKAVSPAITQKPEQTYDVESQGTYSFDMPFDVEHVISQNNDVCMAFHSGRTVTVVGGKGGNTTITVVPKSGESRLVAVNVSAGRQVARAQTELDKVKEMILTLYPDSKIQIQSLKTGELEIKGIVNSEAEAKKILELVRKICLVPVNDKLKALR
jgi:hypothetical protein